MVHEFVINIFCLNLQAVQQRVKQGFVMTQPTTHSALPVPGTLSFIMMDAERCEAPLDIDGPAGVYDPVTQTWIGGIRKGAGSYSNRSNGSKGGYSYQSDD